MAEKTRDVPPVEGVKPFTDVLRMLEGGMLIEVYQEERVFDQAIEDARKFVADGTGLPVYAGKPEQ